MFWKNKPVVLNHVAVVRKSRKLTQAELATACGVTRQTIIAIEKGNYVPSVALALDIAHTLQTSVEKLFMISREQS
jgi:putative transcriptional regulator